MNIAPKVVIALTMCLVILGCGMESKQPVNPEQNRPMEKHETRSKEPGSPAQPDSLQVPAHSSPNRAKKNSGSKLDTLKPIKA